jgi:hypothetical protein
MSNKKELEEWVMAGVAVAYTISRFASFWLTKGK